MRALYSRPIVLAAIANIVVGAAQAQTVSTLPSGAVGIDAPIFLPPPPGNESVQTKAELAELRDIGKTRTPERLERAKSDDRNEDVNVFAETLSGTLDFKSLPATWAFFRALLKEETKASSTPKKFFKRPRPWTLDPAISHCAEAEAGTSYPSGHTSFGFATGIALAALVPQKAQSILDRANDYGYSRLVCGMHYRSDLVAGQVLGTIVAERFLADPANRASFDAARDELAKALQTQPGAVATNAATASPAASVPQPPAAPSAPDAADPAASKLPPTPVATDKGKALGLGPKR